MERTAVAEETWAALGEEEDEEGGRAKCTQQKNAQTARTRRKK